MTRRKAPRIPTIFRSIFTPNPAAICGNGRSWGHVLLGKTLLCAAKCPSTKICSCIALLTDSQLYCSLLNVTPHLIISQILGSEALNTLHAGYAERLCHAKIALETSSFLFGSIHCFQLDPSMHRAVALCSGSTAKKTTL
jgi:hypothetical protein